MGNVDIFETMARNYDSSERVDVTKTISKAIADNLVEINHKDAIDYGFVQSDLIELMNNIGFKNAVAKTFYKKSKTFMSCDTSLSILDAQK